MIWKSKWTALQFFSHKLHRGSVWILKLVIRSLSWDCHETLLRVTQQRKLSGLDIWSIFFITLIVKCKSTLEHKNGYRTLSNRGHTQETVKRDSFLLFLASWLFISNVVLMKVPEWHTMSSHLPICWGFTLKNAEWWHLKLFTRPCLVSCKFKQ